MQQTFLSSRRANFPHKSGSLQYFDSHFHLVVVSIYFYFLLLLLL